MTVFDYSPINLPAQLCLEVYQDLSPLSTNREMPSASALSSIAKF